jgi:hypothetical protein
MEGFIHMIDLVKIDINKRPGWEYSNSGCFGRVCVMLSILLKG